jgi:hypothetical protein
MKLIDQILDGNSDSYITSVTKLEKVLEPFALMVAERMPVFRGVPVESLQTSMCEDCSAIIFSVDNKPLAAVRVEEQEFSVYGEDYIKLHDEDMESVQNLLNALKNFNGKTRSEMPRDLKRLMSILKGEA